MEITYEQALELERNHIPDKQKGTKVIDMDEYIIIPHKFMLLNISANELHAFSLIYSICKNCEQHEFTASKNYIATRLNCSIPYAHNIINKLLEKGFIKKTSDCNKFGTCTYVLPDNLDQVLVNYGSYPL